MELTQLRNIGEEMQRKLHSIGVMTAEDLKQAGSKQTFHRLKAAYPSVCLVHLYVLQGAIDGVDYAKLPERTKAELKEFSDQLKGST